MARVLLAVLAALVAAAIAVTAYYYLWGWQSFSWEGTVPFSENAQVPSFVPAGNASPGLLIFRDAKFSFELPSGGTYTVDVTDRLNNMAAAYPATADRGTTPGVPAALTLAGPLSPLSFPVAGVNAGPGVPAASQWANLRSVLTGKVKTSNSILHRAPKNSGAGAGAAAAAAEGFCAACSAY